MKLLKVGSGSGCNITLHSQFVSGVHAELILLDNGEVLIEDKGSTNGTFVGNQRLRPNVETKIMRGDLVRLGDTELPWQFVPVMRTANYRHIYNIGSSLRNDVKLTSQFGSRYHATLFIDDKGKATIVDNGSKNGTEVNGVRIAKDKPIAIKRGDKVVCGDEDVTDQLKPLLPAKANIPLIAGIGVGALALILAGIFLLPKLFGGSEPTSPMTAAADSAAVAAQAPATHDIAEIRKAVVYVTARYQLAVKLEPCPISQEVWQEIFQGNVNPGEIPFRAIEDSPSGVYNSSYTATAFFLDREGNLATNHHVAEPWTAMSETDQQRILTLWEQALIFREIPSGARGQVIFAANERLTGDAGLVWRAIKAQAAATGNVTIAGVNSIIRQIKKATPKISGKIEDICVGYPGRNYTHADEYERCYVRAVSDNKECDISILQLNNKKTPDDITFVFSPDNFYTGSIEPGKDKLTWVGYPRGTSWNLENSQLEPTIRETKCTKIPSGYSFEFDSEAQPGASGSPLFMTDTGQLVGIMWGERRGASTYSIACQAKYLQKLYNDLP